MVGFNVENSYYEVGSSSFLHSFFSTVAYRLEKGKWGSRFPAFMITFYQGTLEQNLVSEVQKELSIIKEELREFEPDKVIWDIEDLSLQPPWGNNISSDITDLSNYYVTSDGKDFLKVLEEALNKAIEKNQSISIVPM